ncbi:MAG: tetratricopeptide repeat protein [Promethearchaeota archaeon]
MQISEIEEIKLLFFMGSLNQALKRVLELEERSDEDSLKLECQNLRCLIFIQMGDPQGGLRLADQAVEKSQQLGDLLLMLDAMIARATALFELGELDQCLNVINQSNNILIASKANNQPEYSQRNSQLKFLTGKVFRKKGDLDYALEHLNEALAVRQELRKNGEQELENKYALAEVLNVIGIILGYRGENDSALSYIESSLNLFEEIGNREQILKLTNNIGMIYWLKGELDQALDFFQKGLFFSEKVGNKRNYAALLSNIGMIHRNKGNLDAALNYFEKGLKIYEELRSKSELATFYNNIGAIYQIKGELDEASKYYKRSLTIGEELGDKLEIATSLGNIGDVFQYQGDSKRAIKYYERSLALYEEIGNDVNICRILLILIQLHEGSKERVEHYLLKLEKINSKEYNKMINQMYRLGKAIVLKSSGRIIRMAESQQLFQEIAQEETFNVEFTCSSMLHLCELLLQEYKATGKEEIIYEIKSELEQFRKFVEKRHVYHWLAQLYWLESKFSLLELNIERSRRLLSQAIAIAKEKGLGKLAVQITSEYDDLIIQFGKWEELVTQNQPAGSPTRSKIFELSQIEDLVERMIRRRLYHQDEAVLDYAAKAKEVIDRLEEVEFKKNS